MKVKHTPGPWMIIERGVDRYGYAYPRQIVGRFQTAVVCQMEDEVFADLLINNPAWREFAKSEMGIANANLIAAAPDLLEALLEIDHWLVCACIATPEDMAQSFPHMEQVARAAIEKATGG